MHSSLGSRLSIYRFLTCTRRLVVDMCFSVCRFLTRTRRLVVDKCLSVCRFLTRTRRLVVDMCFSVCRFLTCTRRLVVDMCLSVSRFLTCTRRLVVDKCLSVCRFLPSTRRLPWLLRRFIKQLRKKMNTLCQKLKKDLSTFVAAVDVRAWLWRWQLPVHSRKYNQKLDSASIIQIITDDILEVEEKGEASFLAKWRHASPT